MTKRWLDAITDVPGIKVGHWTDRRAATGCTVILAESGAVAAVDVRGGAPGTVETDLLRPENLVEKINAVLLTGGSRFGLEAASGVVNYLAERGLGFETRARKVPLVCGAVLFDLGVGRDDAWPTVASGNRAAASAKGGRVACGSVGAGTGATIAKIGGPDHMLKGGLGTASECADSGLVVGAIAGVNALGDIIDPTSGTLVAGPLGPDGAMRTTLQTLREAPLEAEHPLEPEASIESTTIACLATNATLTKASALRVAIMAHDAIARTVVPAHTHGDGDVVFVLATCEKPLEEGDVLMAGILGRVALERAILRGVTEATSLGGIKAVGDLSTVRVPRQDTLDCH
jgi:L-aminopeptidase/D-esterase-like protein